MLINTPISLGELIDKISILIVKQKNIVEETKLELINKELSFLQETLSKYATKESFDNYLEDLIKINSKLWKIEDDLRECERNKQFDDKFIELARSVYFTNDKRAMIKLDINQSFGSELIEVKSYREY